MTRRTIVVLACIYGVLGIVFLGAALFGPTARFGTRDIFVLDAWFDLKRLHAGVVGLILLVTGSVLLLRRWAEVLRRAMNRLCAILRSRWRAVIIALLAANVALVAAEWLAPSVHSTIVPADIRHVQGHAYEADFDPGWPKSFWRILYQVRTDDPLSPTASDLTITENQAELAPAHVFEDAVAEKGKGSYLHWRNDLVFSTSDNSDPRTNGRVYAVSSETHVNSIVISVVFSITVLALGYLAVARVRAAGVSGDRIARYGCLAGIVFVHVIFLIMFFLRPLYISISPDTWGYLAPALSAASGGPFTQVHARTMGYPIFVYGILSTFHRIPAVVYAQVVLYFGISALLFGSWQIITGKIHRSDRTYKYVFLFLMMSCSIFYSFYHSFIAYIQPDILYSFLAILCMFLVLYLFFRTLSPWLFSLCFLFASFLSVYNFYVKPHWAGAMLFLLALLTVRLFTARHIPTLLRIALPTVSCVVILFVLVFPQQRLSNTYDELAARTFGMKNLFCNNANLVLQYMESPDYQIDRKDEVLVGTVKEALERIVTDGATGGWKRMGFDGDKCMYNDPLSAVVSDHFTDIPSQIGGFYSSHFIAAVLNYPVQFGTRIVEQVLKASVTPIKNVGRSVQIYEEFVYDEAGKYPVFDELLNSKYAISGNVGSVFDQNLVLLLPLLNFIVFLVNPFALLVWIAIGVFVLSRLFSKERICSEAMARSMPCLLITGAYFSGLGVVAVSHTFDIPRYSQILAPLILLSAFSCAYTLVGLAKPKDSQKIPGQPPQARSKA